MPEYKYRNLKPTPEAEEVYRRWLRFLDEEFTRHKDPKIRGELVRDALHQILFDRPHGGKLNFQLNSELAFNSAELSLDPANVTLEPEYYGDIDEAKYAERKPLIWFWQMFDRSPLALNSLARVSLSLHPGPAHLSPYRQKRKNLPWGRVFLRLQPHH